MKATDLLMEEHRLIEQVLATLEQAARFVEGGVPVRAGFFLDMAAFMRGFVDGCHHKKEEGLLFKAMAAHGIPVEGGPVGAMLADHELGRKYTRQMAGAAGRWQAGERAAGREVIDNALAYVDLLRNHIFKEDRVLFVMAAKAIPPGEQEALDEGFEKIEQEETGAGVHEKYLSLAREVASLRMPGW